MGNHTEEEWAMGFHGDGRDGSRWVLGKEGCTRVNYYLNLAFMLSNIKENLNIMQSEFKCEIALTVTAPDMETARKATYDAIKGIEGYKHHFFLRSFEGRRQKEKT